MVVVVVIIVINIIIIIIVVIIIIIITRSNQVSPQGRHGGQREPCTRPPALFLSPVNGYLSTLASVSMSDTYMFRFVLLAHTTMVILLEFCDGLVTFWQRSKECSPSQRTWYDQKSEYNISILIALVFKVLFQSLSNDRRQRMMSKKIAIKICAWILPIKLVVK